LGGGPILLKTIKRSIGKAETNHRKPLRGKLGPKEQTRVEPGKKTKVSHNSTAGMGKKNLLFINIS